MSEENATPEAGATEFTPITSQEDFNKAIAGRLKRAVPADYDDLKAKAGKFDQLEAEKLTETQRLQAERDEFKGNAEKVQRENARLTVIANEGIPKEYQSLVHGDTPEALAESAALAKKLIDAAAKPAGNTVSYVNLDGNGSESLALNGDGIESALKNALGIS